MLTFNHRITQTREKLGYTIEEFGVLGGVGISTQYNYEKGTRKPDIEYLNRLSKIGCDIQYIITGIASNTSLDQEEAKLVELYRSAPDMLKNAALKVLSID